jgi:hypothetical protein
MYKKYDEISNIFQMCFQKKLREELWLREEWLLFSQNMV